MPRPVGLMAQTASFLTHPETMTLLEAYHNHVAGTLALPSSAANAAATHASGSAGDSDANFSASASGASEFEPALDPTLPFPPRHHQLLVRLVQCSALPLRPLALYVRSLLLPNHPSTLADNNAANNSASGASASIMSDADAASAAAVLASLEAGIQTVAERRPCGLQPPRTAVKSVDTTPELWWVWEAAPSAVELFPATLKAAVQAVRRARKGFETLVRARRALVDAACKYSGSTAGAGSNDELIKLAALEEKIGKAVREQGEARQKAAKEEAKAKEAAAKAKDKEEKEGERKAAAEAKYVT